MWALSYTLNKAIALIIVILDATQVSFLPALDALKLTCTECVWLWVGRLKIRDGMNSWFCIFALWYSLDLKNEYRWCFEPAKACLAEAFTEPVCLMMKSLQRYKSISIITNTPVYVNTGVYNRKISFLHISDHKLKKWKYWCYTVCMCLWNYS